MATKKKVVAKKAPAKKAVAKKAPTKKKVVAKKVPAKKVTPKKAPVKKKKAAAKKVAKAKYTPEQVYSMIEQAAYFAAVNDGFQKDPTTYWAQAEGEINALMNG